MKFLSESEQSELKSKLNIEDGDIVLMHDIHQPTMEAALELIPKLKRNGYELVTVSELAKYRGNGLKKGIRYYNF